MKYFELHGLCLGDDENVLVELFHTADDVNCDNPYYSFRMADRIKVDVGKYGDWWNGIIDNIHFGKFCYNAVISIIIDEVENS